MGPENKQPMLDRLYYGDDDVSVLQFQKGLQRYISSPTYSGPHTTPEQRAIKQAFIGPTTYFDAGTLPEIVITPPKDNALYKMNYMIPNKELRNSFYNTLEKESVEDQYSSRSYINKLWEIYTKSQRPTIKPVSGNKSLLQRLGIMKGDGSRAHYNPFTNTMYIDPNNAAEDITAEMAHAYQFNGTDTPRSFDWIKQIFSLPGDIKIGGMSGYNRPGNIEYVAHKIIEPRLRQYLINENTPWNFTKNSIQQQYNRKSKLIKRGPKINTYMP